MSLSYTYARCATENCPIAMTCARYIVPGRGDRTQPSAIFAGGKDCNGWIEATPTEIDNYKKLLNS